MSERHLRTEILYGKENMSKIKNAHVAIIGLGAVGSHAVEGIARSGVGKITIVDFDEISLSNFNRQLYAIEPNLGRYKTDASEERIHQIDPKIQVIKYNTLCHKDNFEKIFSDRPDVVIDAIDTLNPKVNMLLWLAQNDIKVISSMGAARKHDPTKIKIDTIFKATHCPLAKVVKKRLRRYECPKDFKVIFSTEVVKKNSIAEKPEANFLENEGRKRIPMGSSPMITGIFGYYCALEAINIVLKK